jgi:hypothetical protein
MMIAIPPKYSVARVIGYIKGESAIHLAGVWRTEVEVYRLSRGRVSDPVSFLSGSQLKTSGFAGGILTQKLRTIVARNVA